MQVVVEKLDNDICQLMISGRLDANTANSFDIQVREVIEKNNLRLIFNFTDLAYISSAGLRILITTMKILNAKQGLLVLCELKDVIYEVLKISGFTSIFNIQNTQQEALEQF